MWYRGKGKGRGKINIGVREVKRKELWRQEEKGEEKSGDEMVELVRESGK